MEERAVIGDYILLHSVSKTQTRFYIKLLALESLDLREGQGQKTQKQI